MPPVYVPVGPRRRRQVFQPECDGRWVLPGALIPRPLLPRLGEGELEVPLSTTGPTLREAAARLHLPALSPKAGSRGVRNPSPNLGVRAERRSTSISRKSSFTLVRGVDEKKRGSPEF